MIFGVTALHASEQSDIVSSELHNDKALRIQESATRWGLSAEQWKTYEELMRGEAKFMLPNVDPLTVLGTYAETESERREYGERIARMEYEFTKRFLALRNSYHDAFGRLYGNEPMLSINSMEYIKDSIGRKEKPLSQFGNRYILFVNSNCKECDRVFKSIQSRRGIGSFVDIYFVKDNKSQIINWGKRMGVKPDHVKSGLITLNQDNGQYAKYKRPALPAAYYFDSKSGSVQPYNLE